MKARVGPTAEDDGGGIWRQTAGFHSLRGEEKPACMGQQFRAPHEQRVESKFSSTSKKIAWLNSEWVAQSHPAVKRLRHLDSSLSVMDFCNIINVL